MEPVLCKQPFDSKKHLFQVKWDGVHVLAYVNKKGILLYNRKQNERTMQFREIVKALDYLPSGTVLDGEVVCLNKAGKPDFFLVLKRDQTKLLNKIKILMNTHPVHYMVFDIIYLNGESLIKLPLYERLKILKKTIQKSNIVHVVDSIKNEGKALFKTVRKEGMEGIVAKVIESPYIIGQKSELWKKIKAWRKIDTIIGGWTQSEGQLRSLLVGINQEEGLLYVGRVASGLTSKQRTLLRQYFLANDNDIETPFINPPSKAKYHWVKPSIGVTIRYIEWSNDNKMRSPTIIDLKEINDAIL